MKKGWERARRCVAVASESPERSKKGFFFSFLVPVLQVLYSKGAVLGEGGACALVIYLFLMYCKVFFRLRERDK